MMLYDLFSWIGTSSDVVSFSPSIVNLSHVLHEQTQALHNRRVLISELREKKFSRVDVTTTRDCLERHNAYSQFTEFCHHYLLQHQETNTYFLGLIYLLNVGSDEEYVVDRPHKIKQLFLLLLSQRKEDALGFFAQHPSKFATFPEITRAVEMQRSVDITIDRLNQLNTQLQFQENALALVPIFNKSVGDPELLAADILWLLQREVSVKRVLQSNLLQNFMSYHLAYLDSDDSPIKYFYRLLEQFDEAQELIFLAGQVPCEERGFHCDEDGEASYSITGVLRDTTELECLDVLPSPIVFTPSEENFNALYQLFGLDFLQLAVSWYAQSEDEDWQRILSDFFSRDAESVSRIIHSSVNGSPEFLEILAALIDDSTAEKLVQRHNGAILSLLPYKPYLRTKLGACDIRAYLAQLTTESHFDAIPSLIALFTLFRGVNIPAALLVYEAILERVLLHPECIEDSELLKTLKKFANKKSIIDQKNNELQEAFEQCIREQVSEGALSPYSYYVLEDVWLRVSRQLKLLRQIMPITNTCPRDKYKLQARMAKICFLRDPDHFNLFDFFSVLEINPDLSSDGVNAFERLLIEMLTSIDHEFIRASIVRIFDSNEIKSQQWMQTEYGGLCVFDRAIQCNNLGLVQWLESRVPFDAEQALSLAADSLQWDMVRHFVNGLIDAPVHKDVLKNVLFLSAGAGQLDIVRFLFETMKLRLDPNSIKSLWMDVVENNHIDAVIYLYEMPVSRPCETVRVKAFKKAIHLKHLDLIEILGNFSDDDKLSRVISNALDRSVIFDSLPIIQRLCSLKRNAPSQNEIEKAFIRAIEYGHLPIARYLCSLGFETSPRRIIIDKALAKAIGSKSLHTVGFLFSLSHHCPTQLAIEKALQKSVTLNQLDFVTILCTGTKTPPRPQSIQQALCVAISSGFVPIAKFLCGLANAKLMDQSFQWAAQHGQLDILEHCDRLSPQPKQALRLAIRQAHKNHHADVVAYLQTALTFSLQGHTARYLPVSTGPGVRRSISCSGLGLVGFFQPIDKVRERPSSSFSQMGAYDFA